MLGFSPFTAADPCALSPHGAALALFVSALSTGSSSPVFLGVGAHPAPGCSQPGVPGLAQFSQRGKEGAVPLTVPARSLQPGLLLF